MSSSSSSSSVVYLRPNHTLSQDQLKEYWSKIQPYKEHWVTVTRIGDLADSIETEPGVFETRQANKQYRKGPLIFIRNGAADQSDLARAYLWEFKAKQESELDEDDRRMCCDPNKITERYELYGYHTYGGYYGFFRPDLKEVIHLIHTVIPLDQLHSVKRMYVTTDTHPTDNVGACYDVKKDMHKAKTIVYVVRHQGAGAPGGADHA
jgi:hypothetical protein